jgi:hypothetical protein
LHCTWAAQGDRVEAILGSIRMQRRDGLRHLLGPRILLARPASIRGRGACERDTSSLANNICRIAERARERYDTNNLVIAGGVGLNSCANWRIQQKGIFDNVWIQPAAGDDGGALGRLDDDALVAPGGPVDPRRQRHWLASGANGVWPAPPRCGATSLASGNRCFKPVSAKIEQGRDVATEAVFRAESVLGKTSQHYFNHQLEAETQGGNR